MIQYGPVPETPLELILQEECASLRQELKQPQNFCETHFRMILLTYQKVTVQIGMWKAKTMFRSFQSERSMTLLAGNRCHTFLLDRKCVHTLPDILQIAFKVERLISPAEEFLRQHNFQASASILLTAFIQKCSENQEPKAEFNDFKSLQFSLKSLGGREHGVEKVNLINNKHFVETR